MCLTTIEEKVFKGYNITKKEAVSLCTYKQVDSYISWGGSWYVRYVVIVRLSDGKFYKIEYIKPEDGDEDENRVYSPKAVEVQKECKEVTEWSEVK